MQQAGADPGRGELSPEMYESNFIHHVTMIFCNSENNIHDIKPFCHLLFCHSSIMKYTSSPLQ